MAKHKHAELIKAWADGAKIQCRDSGKYLDTPKPQWHEHWEYRIKPEPKPDRTFHVLMELGGNANYPSYICCTEAGNSNGLNRNIKLVFDGETGKLKKVELV